MTVIDLAKLCAVHIGQGRGNFQVTMFNCPELDHGAQFVEVALEREGTDTLEFYPVRKPWVPKLDEQVEPEWEDDLI